MASSLGEGGIGGTISVAIFFFFFLCMKTEKSKTRKEIEKKERNKIVLKGKGDNDVWNAIIVQPMERKCVSVN